MPSLLSLLALAGAAHVSAYTFDPLQHLAGIAPYFEPANPPFDPAVPLGCNVTRAAYLVRHAAIYANDFDYETYIEPFVKKLANTTVDWSKAGNLSFLATWKSPIREEDIEKLTDVGTQEATNLGAEVKSRYPGFRAPRQVWSSTADRTVKSAASFIRGYGAAQEPQLVGVDEGKQAGANSLTPYSSCPAYSSSRGSEQSQTFQKIYTAPIIARFNASAPAFNFTANDVFGMQQLCGYETVITGHLANQGYAINGTSPFCSPDLFTPDEWLGFEYTNDLQYFHNVGYGNPVSGAIGLPWAKTTADLLLTNNASAAAQDLYVSFTHRELPPTVLVALGLFNNSAFSASGDVNATMPLDAINPSRAWISSSILPFLANIAVERLDCPRAANYSPGDYYRVLVNHAPQPLPACRDGPALSCSASVFRAYVDARHDLLGGFSQTCGVAYANSTDALGIYAVQKGSDGGNGTGGARPGKNAAGVAAAPQWTWAVGLLVVVLAVLL